MTTRVLLIRHGQTDWNAVMRWQGHRDIPLNDAGMAQARALAKRMKGWQVEALYTSDLKRAFATAGPIAEALDLEPVVDPRWRERDVGAFEGLTTAEVREAFPNEWQEMLRGILNPPRGEEHLVFYDRASAAFNGVAERHSGGTAAVVTHGGVIATIVAYVLQLGPNVRRRYSIRGNTSLNIVEIGEHGPVLTLLNDTSHLVTANNAS